VFSSHTAANSKQQGHRTNATKTYIKIRLGTNLNHIFQSSISDLIKAEFDKLLKFLEMTLSYSLWSLFTINYDLSGGHPYHVL
jgi:hypothetical protein